MNFAVLNSLALLYEKYQVNIVTDTDKSCCSDPSWGGRNYILKQVFFVQSILADRYIHRRELRLASLESLSSVEYRIKKIFWFSSLTGRYRGLNFRENRVNSVDFIHIFRNFWQKFNKIFQENVVDFKFKDKIYCQLFALNFFVTNSGKIFHKIQNFSSKTARNKFL